MVGMCIRKNDCSINMSWKKWCSINTSQKKKVSINKWTINTMLQCSIKKTHLSFTQMCFFFFFEKTPQRNQDTIVVKFLITTELRFRCDKKYYAQ